MAADTNGRFVESSSKGMNGHAKVPVRKSMGRKSRFSWMFSTISRMVTWFSIITILFRCPQTADLLTAESPMICKPYFQIRSFLSPHLEPYYNTYAAPYVDTARPYYNTLDQRIITPATVLGKKYGAPRVAQAQAFGQAQWNKNFQPQVSKYQNILKDQYGQTLEPHVNAAVATTYPYYQVAKTNALQTYHEHILPAYTVTQPYVLAGYGVASDFAVNTAYPYSKWAWVTGAVFMDRTVWPKLRVLYGENVEPQVVRIGERLGRYRDGKKIKAVVEEYDSSSSVSAVSTSVASISSSIASVYSTSAPTTTNTLSIATDGPNAVPESEREIREEAQKVVTHDLKEWQDKFAKAADEGSDDLEERITEITDRLINTQAVKVGNALIIQLEETVKSSFEELKANIITAVKDNTISDDLEDAVALPVRKAGVAIKGKAQAIRTWRQSFDMETNTLVSKAAENTFEILDIIRDSGLQEIGQRWAWTEGVTHKDWTRYHKLKTKFDEWRYDVEKVATGHPGLERARAASAEVESRAMDIAEDAAKELARLKEVGIWKLTSSDASDDFSTRYIPAEVAAAKQKVLDKVSDLSSSIAPTSQGTVESVVSAASSVASSQVDNAQSSVSSLSASIIGTSQGSVESVVSGASASASSIAAEVSSSVIGTSQGTVESAISAAKNSASSVVDQASKSVIGTSQGSVESIVSGASASASSIAAEVSSSVIGTSQGTVESVVSVAKDSASSIVDQASKSVIGSSQGTIESVASVVGSSASSLSARASSSVVGQKAGVAEKAASSVKSAASIATDSASSIVSESASSVSSAASSASSAASRKVFGGAMAQHVEERKIIFEDVIDESDDDTFSDRIQSMASEAGDRYSDITRAVSEALLKTSSVASVASPVATKLAASKYSSALSAASIALYGTPQGSAESMSSVASSRYADAISAASAIIYGTPTPLTDSVAAQATSAYVAAVSRASAHYSNAKSVVSAQISGEPKPIHQEMYSSVDSAYSDSVAAASSRLQSALSVASTAVYGTPTPSYQSVIASLSSVAQSRLSDGLSAASSRWEASKSYVQGINTGAPQKQKLLSQMQGQYYAGIGMAYARYSDFVDAASSAVMPRETPFHESLYSKASVGIVGTTTNQYQAALATAESYYSSAVAGASNQLDGLISSVSSAAGGQQDYVASLAAVASSKYVDAVASASKSYESIQSVISSNMELAASSASSVVIGSETPWTESVASAASSAIIGGETPWTESVASAASDNWEALITKASEQIYGAPTPYFITQGFVSGASQYAAQATEAAISQYSAVQSLIGELIVGKEPDFTESVYNRFSSAYYTGAGQAAASASSIASEAYGSASSVISAIFTPPPQLETILDTASSNINAVVEAMQVGVSEKIYGTSTGYIEAAQSSVSDAASSAQKAISEAIYGTPTPTGTYDSLTSAATEAYASATSAVSAALFGPEKDAVDSAQSRLSAAVESARVKFAEYAATVGDGASGAVKQASDGVEEFASSVSSALHGAKTPSHDEL